MTRGQGVIVEGEEELGPQRTCSGCGETWPLDPDFFYVARRKGGRVSYETVCRACRKEQQEAARVERTARQSRVPMGSIPLSSSKASPDRAAWKRLYDQEYLTQLTPEEREARRQRRRLSRAGRVA